MSVAALRFKISTSSALLPTSNGTQAASNAPTATLTWTKLVRVLCATERPTASVITLGKQPSLLLRNQDASNPAARSEIIDDQHTYNSPVCLRV